MNDATYLVVDAGTSRTRVRLWHQGAVVDEGSEAVGAKDVALAGDSAPIAEALARLIPAVRSGHDLVPAAVVCSGMITSNVGLVEVPHETAPVGLHELARRLVRHDVPAVTELPVYFVPGVKTVAEERDWQALSRFDVMRGEEVEVAGLLAALDLEPPLAFFHCGSHHKLIEVGAPSCDEGPVVLRSSTSITGELLAAVRERTILASSLEDLAGLKLDSEAITAGVRHASEFGFGRAAFLVRVGQVIAGLTRAEATALLVGALTALDLQLIAQELGPDQTLVLYGGGVFPSVLRHELKREGRQHVRLVDAATSGRVATTGAVRLLEEYLTHQVSEDRP